MIDRTGLGNFSMILGEIRENLVRAELHVVEGRALVAKQRSLLAKLEEEQRNAFPATELLALFEQTQAQFVAERNWLRKELAHAERKARQHFLGPREH